MAPWTSPPNGLPQDSLVVREAAGGAWSLAEHFPALVASPALGSLLQLGPQSSVRDTLRGGLAAGLPLTTPGPVHLSGGDPLLQSAHPRPEVTWTVSGAEKPRRRPAVWGREGHGGEGRAQTVAAGTAAFTLSPLVPIFWLLASVAPVWKPQGTRIPQVPPAAANTS